MKRRLLWLIPIILLLAVAAFIVYPYLPFARDKRWDKAREKIEGLGCVVRLSAGEAEIDAGADLGDDDLGRVCEHAGDFDAVLLDLSETKVTAAGLKHLESLSNLKQLNLTGLSLTDASLARLSDLKRLEQLHLGKTGIGNDGLQHLRGLTSVRRLFLDDNPGVTGAGLASLADLGELRDLQLNRTRVDDVGLQQLKGLKKLEKLYLRGTSVTPGGIAVLEMALPELKVLGASLRE